MNDWTTRSLTTSDGARLELIESGSGLPLVMIPESGFCLLEAGEGGHHLMFMENPNRFNAERRALLGSG
jgi:hypothetical protein